MNREEIISFLGEDWTLTMTLLKEGLYSDVQLLRNTNELILSHSGKLIRPILTLLLSKAMGEPNEDSCRFAAACEMLHNATLMHDDVADESPQRRGRPTVSAMLGPTAAVLIGDFWLSKAVQTVLSSSALYDQLVKNFSTSLTELAEGEMLQMEKASLGDTSEDDYFRIIACKTASLFKLTGISAAVSVSASDEYNKAATDFAFAYGMAFQIKDDILDYAGTDEIGKPRAVDIKEQKITLPLLGAMKNAGARKEAQIRKKITEIDSHPEYVKEVLDFVQENSGVEYASFILNEYIDKAISSLSILPDNKAKDYLIQIVKHNAFRSK